MKLGFKINFSFLTTFFLILAIALSIIGFYDSSFFKKNTFSHLISSNRSKAEHVRTFIQDQKKSAVILGAASVYLDFLREPVTSKQYAVIKEKVEKRFIRTIEADPQIYESLILDASGKIVASSNKTEEGLDKSNEDLFFNAKEEIFFKDLYFSESEGVNKISYAISVPVKNDQGELLGISVLKYTPEHLFSISKNENSLGKTEDNFLINRDKFLITPSRFLDKDLILKQKIDTVNSRACFDQKEIEYIKKNGYSGLEELMGSQVSEFVDYRNVKAIGTHAYIPETGWCLITKTDASDMVVFRVNLIIVFASVFLFAVIIFLIIGSVLSKRIVKPILILKLLAEKIKQGDFNFKSNIDTKDEIGDLSKAFDVMSSAIRDSREGVEKKIEERTQELELKTKQMAEQKLAIMNILEDVQNEKNKSEELANIVRDANEPIISQDLDGIILSWNKGAEDLYQYTAEEVIGKSIEIIIPADQVYLNREAKMGILSGNQVEHFQTVRKKKNGELVDVSISFSPLKNSSGKISGLSVVAINTTKEREIDKAKTEFVSLASHQLRTPLSAINWYAEMLLAGDAGKLTEEQERYLKEIYAGNQRMVALVNALLNVSRLDLGTFIIEPVQTDIPEMIKSVIGELKAYTVEKKIIVKEVYQENLPKFLADQSLLRIIFQNLLSNSVKYTPANGSVSIDVSVLHTGEMFGSKEIKKDSFVFSVSDSGMGVPVDQQDKIFSKLFRADNARETETEGTGLGLYIVKSIIDKSEGEIWFESEENKGTTFYVIFPISGMKKKEGTRKLD